MRKLLLYLILLVPLITSGQTTSSVSRRFSRNSDQLSVAEADGTAKRTHPYLLFEFKSIPGATISEDAIQVIYNNNVTSSILYPVNRFLKADGTQWGSSSDVAVSNFQASVPSMGGGSGGGTSPTIITATDNYITTTSSGTITTGTYVVSIANIGSATGTITTNSGTTTTLSVGTSITFPQLQNALHGSFTYNATGTTFGILTSR